MFACFDPCTPLLLNTSSVTCSLSFKPYLSSGSSASCINFSYTTPSMPAVLPRWALAHFQAVLVNSRPTLDLGKEIGNHLRESLTLIDSHTYLLSRLWYPSVLDCTFGSPWYTRWLTPVRDHHVMSQRANGWWTTTLAARNRSAGLNERPIPSQSMDTCSVLNLHCIFRFHSRSMVLCSSSQYPDAFETFATSNQNLCGCLFSKRVVIAVHVTQ